jgi:signal transduction histidine kinase/CheY-like chemotaxis protein
MIGYYQGPLVLMSVLVAIMASYTTLSLADRVASARGRAARVWIAGGAVAMGTGIWAMHFVGMLAFRLPIPLGYDLRLTLLSWLLPIVVSALALWRLSGVDPGWRQLAVPAMLIGLGISAMHYVGMAAMRMQPGIEYSPWLVCASVLIAIAASAASLVIAFKLRREPKPRVGPYRSAAAVAMGVAIAGMHYTGMAAAHFPPGSICGAATGTFTLAQLATLVVLATVGILAIALLTSAYDARLEARSSILAISEQTARERQALLDRERAARAEAERLSALKDEFLATLSHELRTPLNAILGWTQLLRVRQDEATLLRGLETIERNARLQARLIDDLLDMSRIVSGHVRLELELIEPWTVVEAAVEAARPAAFSKQIELVARLDRHCGKVWADPGRLQQVMWNLLSNATKFTPAGGHIEITLQAQAGTVVAEVTDSGAGISAEFLPHVFERFRQADSSTTRRHGGLGLGLAIVRQLVELHGGTVEAQSLGEGQGARFAVRLPLASAKASTLPGHGQGDAADSATAEPPRLTDLQGLSVLVVDDEPDARQLLAQLLQSCNASVQSAASVEQAFAALAKERVDAVVSDVAMPEADGFSLVRRLRAMPDGRLARLPTIALSAFTRQEDEQRALREGFDAYLPKPVDAARLTATLERLALG